MEAYRFYRQTPPREPTDDDLHAWCLARINQLCGATSFTEGFEQHEVITLLALGFIDVARGADLSTLQVSQSMRVPAAASRLEPDFFPVLLQEVNARAGMSPSFSADLEKAKQWVWQTADSLRSTSPDTGDILNGVLGFIVIAAVVRWTLRGKQD